MIRQKYIKHGVHYLSPGYLSFGGVSNYT